MNTARNHRRQPPPAPGHPRHPGPADHGPATSLPAELAAILAEVTPAGGRFGHREHIHLAYLAVQRYGAGDAAGAVAGWLRHLSAYQRAPQKFHATVTRAWTELVAQHAADCPPGTSFAAFAQLNPGLLDKRLLTRHYSPQLLASPAARTGWAEPDLAAFPWPTGPGHEDG
jgi:hypothetical protein